MSQEERYKSTENYTETLTHLPQPIKAELVKSLPMIQAAYAIGFDAGKRHVQEGENKELLFYEIGRTHLEE